MDIIGKLAGGSDCTHGGAGSERLHVAQKFEGLLAAHRRPDGSRWTGQQLDEATGGVVPRSYVTNLRKGRIENPGYEKMLATAKAMSFPPAACFEDVSGERAAHVEGRDLVARIGQLFETIRHPRTGEPYTNAEVARMSVGVLTEEVEGIRTSDISDPTVGQVAALAAAFGVEPSYLVDRKEPPTLDTELMEGLSAETAREITREVLRLPERERGIMLGIVRQFGDEKAMQGGSAGRGSESRHGMSPATCHLLDLVLALLFGAGFFYYYVAGVVEHNHTLSRASALAFIVCGLVAVVMLARIVL